MPVDMLADSAGEGKGNVWYFGCNRSEQNFSRALGRQECLHSGTRWQTRMSAPPMKADEVVPTERVLSTALL
jgi:hypothetical protein